MKRVSFSKPIELFSGLIGLTDAQASVRAHSLKPVGKDVYEIVGKVEFKAGEQVKMESIPKALAALPAGDPDKKSAIITKLRDKIKVIERKNDPED